MLTDHALQDSLALAAERLIRERLEVKEAYIAAYLASTGDSIEDVELVEQSHYTGTTVLTKYFLRRKDLTSSPA